MADIATCLDSTIRYQNVHDYTVVVVLPGGSYMYIVNHS